MVNENCLTFQKTLEYPDMSGGQTFKKAKRETKGDEQDEQF
jgi:hypothetical protein